MTDESKGWQILREYEAKISDREIGGMFVSYGRSFEKLFTNESIAEGVYRSRLESLLPKEGEDFGNYHKRVSLVHGRYKFDERPKSDEARGSATTVPVGVRGEAKVPEQVSSRDGDTTGDAGKDSQQPATDRVE